MSNWKILITDGLEENGQSVLRQSAHVDDKNGISPEELLKIISEYDAVIVRGRTKVTAAILDAGKRLKVVGRSGVGVDNIDLEAAKQKKIIVVNAPVATTIAVAELTMSLMLASVREVPRADATMKAGKWIKKELEGAELYQKVLGVIGFGRIGTAVAQRGAAFGMRVIGYDPIIKPEDIRKQGAEPVSLDTLFLQADVITLHVPLTPNTRNIINADAITKMKPGVRIICAARGGVIDEEALLSGLNSGIISSAALDVFASEPPGQTALVSHPHVICTPHIGAQTVEAQQRAAADISSEVLAALQGEALRWKVA
jgi:D-3-phosphoglycerate dehydrogenase / 2-oxoglutarate reductase